MKYSIEQHNHRCDLMNEVDWENNYTGDDDPDYYADLLVEVKRLQAIEARLAEAITERDEYKKWYETLGKING